MKLAIICGGEIFTVTDKLDEYDLDNVVSTVHLCEMIKFEKKRIKKYEDAYQREVANGR